MDGPAPRAGAATGSTEAVDRGAARPDRGQRRQGLGVIAVIAAGGALGACARYGVGLALPQRPEGWPWSTLLVNATGCLLIGVLMVLIAEVWVGHRLIRPFLGVGVLGGYTTFSTYAVEVQQLIVAGRPGLALIYMAATVVAALVAVQLGVGLSRALSRRMRRGRGR